MARLRSAPSTQNAAPTKQTRPALKDRTNTATTNAPVHEDDGDADDLIKDARPRRGQRKKAAHKDDEYVMAGGLGLRDPDDIAVAPDGPPTTTDELAKSDGPPRLSMKARQPSRTTKTAAPSKAQSKAQSGPKSTRATVRKQVNGKQKNDLVDDEIVISSSEAAPAKPPKGRRSNQSRPERSDFSVSPSPPPAGKLHSVKRSSLAQSGSALRPQSTPAVESSISALKNFKRRQRQPSMLQMVQQRTASARPSVVNTSTIQNVGGLNLDDDDLEGEEDFAPDAEGTPVLLKKKKIQEAVKKGGAAKEVTGCSIVAPSSAQSRKRKSSATEDSTSALDALRAKRQRESGPAENDFLRVDSPARRSSSEQQRSPQPELTSDVQVINSSPSSTPPSEPPSSRPRHGFADPEVVVPSTEHEKDHTTEQDPLYDEEDDAEDAIPNATMAEPLSSSPLPTSPAPLEKTQQTDIMADPLSQISPARPKVRDKKQKEQKPKPLNTATLQALLPKRRQPLKQRERKSIYDVDSDSEDDQDEPIDTSHLDEDEDELSGGARRRTKATAAAKSWKSTTAKSKAALFSSRKSTRKQSTAPRKSKAGQKPSKTYGRGAASDKENEDDFEDADNDDSLLPDTSISMYEATKSAELEAAKKKFAELDDWDMEFESVTVEEGRSSSQLWR